MKHSNFYAKCKYSVSSLGLKKGTSITAVRSSSPTWWKPDWNNTKRQQSKLFLHWRSSVLLCFRCVVWVECLTRLLSVSRECTDWDRQVETETTEEIETQLDIQSRMSRSTHARARWTCAHSQTVHTTRKWHTQVSDSDVAHVHIFTSREVEPVSWCGAVLNFKGHLRHSNQNWHTGTDSHTFTWMNSRL